MSASQPSCRLRPNDTPCLQLPRHMVPPLRESRPRCHRRPADSLPLPPCAVRTRLRALGEDAAFKLGVRPVEDLGFDAVDAGGLDEAWRQQPGTPVFVADLDAVGVRRALVAAKPERAVEWRACRWRDPVDDRR